METQKRLILWVAALAIVLIVGGFWWASSQGGLQPTAPRSDSFQEVVDRGMTEEVEVFLTEKVERLQGELTQKETAGESVLETRLLLGNTYYSMGQLGLAVEQYEVILDENPLDIAARENLGQAFAEGGDYVRAEAVWREVIALTGSEVTYLRLAQLITEQFPERLEEVGPLMEQGVAHIGQTPGLLVALGNWYKEKGMLDEAVSHYEVAYRLDPTDQPLKQALEELRQLRAQEQQQKARRAELNE